MSETKRVRVGQQILRIDPNLIRPKKGQPREYFSEEAMKQLITSIKQNGQMLPGQVRKIPTDKFGHEYEIVAGERRWRACKELGIYYDAIVVGVKDDREHYELSVVENFNRQAHTDHEELLIVKRLKEENNHSVEEIAALMGRSLSWVYGRLHIINSLPQEIINMLDENIEKSKRLRLYAAQILADAQDVVAEDLLELAKKMVALKKPECIGILNSFQSEEVLPVEGSGIFSENKNPYIKKRGFADVVSGIKHIPSSRSQVFQKKFVVKVDVKLLKEVAKHHSGAPIMGYPEGCYRGNGEFSGNQVTGFSWEKQGKKGFFVWFDGWHSFKAFCAKRNYRIQKDALYERFEENNPFSH